MTPKKITSIRDMDMDSAGAQGGDKEGDAMTTPTTITLPLLVCLRCGHGDLCDGGHCKHAPMPWIQTGKERPRQCPACHSSWWDRPRKAGKKVTP